MGARNDLRKALAHRLVPLLSDTEKLIHRYGYLRTFSEAVAIIGTFGVLGTVLGISWLRIVFATSAAAFFLLIFVISLTSLSAMRARLHRTEALLHGYARTFRALTPLSVKSWCQEFVIEPNGDAFITATVTLNASSGNEPRFLDAYYSYYGADELTSRDRRRVHCRAWLATETDRNSQIRADATSTWTTTPDGHPRLEILVHFGNVVQQGDLVSIQLEWPGYSADLMSGRAPEKFDTRISSDVGYFESTVVFKGTAENNSFVIRNEGTENLRRTHERGDTVVRITDTRPERNTVHAFVADFQNP